MNVDRRLLALGDWHWLVRDPLDVLRAVFFAGTIAFAIMSRSTAVGLTAASLVLLLSRIINVPRRFDLGVIVAMTLIAWGTALSLYGRFGFYDTIVHGVAPLFYAPVLYVCLVRLGVLADPEQTTAPRQHLGVLVSTLAIGMAVSAGYEVIEWLSDSLAGTHFVESVDDTGRDLLAGTLGSFVGGVFLAVWSISSWTSRRVTYRPVPAPDTRRWRRRGRAIVRGGRSRIERTGPAALGAAGLAAVAFGVVVAVWPDPTVRTLAILFGTFAVGYGVLRLVAAFRGRGRTAGLSLLVEAIVYVGVGIVILAWPRISAALLFYLMAIAMVVGGLAGAALASVLELGVRDRILLGTAAGISTVLGIVVLAWPGDAVNVLRWLIAVQALLAGPVLVVATLRARRSSPQAVPGAADAGCPAASGPEVESAE